MSGKCNALLIADRVIREDNGKRGIIGSFNTFNIPRFPWVVPPFFIYANIEGLAGEIEFSLNIVRSESDLVVFSFGGELKSLDPEKETELLVPVLNLQFPKTGIYTLLLNVGGYQYGSRKLIVNEAPQPQQKGAPT